MDIPITSIWLCYIWFIGDVIFFHVVIGEQLFGIGVTGLNTTIYYFSFLCFLIHNNRMVSRSNPTFAYGNYFQSYYYYYFIFFAYTYFHSDCFF